MLSTPIFVVIVYTEMKKHVELVITGLVQGVGFRAAARRRARLLGLVGWVTNQSDGTVKAVLEGETRPVEAFINWCHEGSMLSRVKQVAVTEGPLVGYSCFEVHR